jgi:protocatechuate 3,4-dioxygenase beta subunit
VCPAWPATRRDGAPARTGTSRIRGRVILADTGQPARRATIRVTGPELREPKSSVTDADGRYEIADLPSGRYFLSASKSTYVTINYGRTRPMEPARPLEVGDNQAVEKVDFSLPRGGVIAGRVLDEYGEPIANAMVQPMQNRFLNAQQRPMMSGQPVTTSDTGEYRLWGLSPGQYYVSVNPRSMGGFTADNSDDRSAYAATFYPGTANLAEAQAVTIAAGQTASGVDIMLTLTRTSRVSGTVVDSTGQPLRMGGVVMAMQRSTSGVMSSQGGPIRSDGTFVVSGLAPGEYTLRANAPQTRSSDRQRETMVANVTVAGSDITGVVLAPVQPVVVKGRIVFDPPAPALQASMIQVMTTPRNLEPTFMPIGQGPPLVNEDFTFELKASPGQILIRAIVRGPMGPSTAPWVVKSVRHHTDDITDTGFELTSGEAIDDVEIVLTNRVQVVSGQITDARGQAVTDATVLIFAQSRERWNGMTRYQAMAKPDGSGRYTARTLPSGDYYAIAMPYVDQIRQGGDPSYYEELVVDAVRFTLGEEETRSVDLKLVGGQ